MEYMIRRDDGRYYSFRGTFRDEIDAAVFFKTEPLAQIRVSELPEDMDRYHIHPAPEVPDE